MYNSKSCTSCDSEDFHTVVKGPIVEIIKCDQCGLMRQGSIVRKEAYSFTGYAGSSQRYSRQRSDKERVQLADFRKIINQLDRYLPQKGSLLEVGCAMGTTLNEFQQAGWLVTGVEPDKNTCTEAQTRYGLNVINTTFQGAGFAKESFDAILLLHVIEHLPDPCEGLHFLTDLLKPGGVLVLETPRYDTVSFKLLKGRERSVIPGHLYYFTKRTLQQQVEKTGLKELKFESVGRTVTLDRLTFYLAKLIDTTITSHAIAKISDSLRLHKRTIHVNLHDMMRVYLIKQ